jgi:predicted dehydrogenase
MLNIGIIGAGNIAKAHAQAFSALRDLCTVVAVAEPNTERVEAIHGMFGRAVRIVGDYRELLADPEIDAVDILLPHDLHAPATCAAAQAGKHVLVEKVMARTTAECDQMLAACEKAKVTLTVCHDRRYDAGWEAIKNLIVGGALGEIFFYKLTHNQNVAVPSGRWVRSRERLGGGAIMSCLTHQIDGLRWFGGEIAAVTCMTQTIPARMEGETCGVVLARMQSGALAELSINWWTNVGTAAHGLYYELIQVCGTRGEAFWKRMMYDDGVTMVRLYDTATPAAIAQYGSAALEEFVPIAAPTSGGHAGCLREWVKLLRGEPADVRTSGRECRQTVAVAEAAYRSEQTGRTVAIRV